MLESITVKNMALIKEAQLELTEGLNILSGETGAGKSILIGSVNSCLGAKADKSMIREGAEYALTELVFRIEKPELLEAIKAMELPVEEDGRLIISRRIGQKSSSLRICGENVSVRQVRDLAALLIDVHGQHEHQSLLHASRHLELLDAYLGGEIEGELAQITELYREYSSLKERLESLEMDEGRRDRELSLAEYEINEIEEAGIRPGEEAELEEEFRRMKKGRDAFEHIRKAEELLSEESGGALEPLGRAVQELRNAASADEELEDCSVSLSDAEGMLRDCLRELSDHLEDSRFDPGHFAETEERLDVIRRILARYGPDEETVLAFLEKRRAEAEELKDLDRSREKLGAELDKCKKKLDKHCDALHEKRTKASKALEERIRNELTELNFLKADFCVKLETTAQPGPSGRDTAEFLISLNPGEKLRPLKDIASGGELSRIMLALKSVFAEKDAIDTLIFDEIDSGISGRTAWKVAEKMGKLSRSRQLICITHLPQIASMADSHFLIEKGEAEGRTETEISRLTDEEETREIARMLAGDAVTDTVLANAKQLKCEACEVKAGI
ncbi:MAG: DNA repair protein RecN [Lachnospiraceae bacterium]|nr:DNA repair protein RecN [Lachnospiraceae bacterium]